MTIILVEDDDDKRRTIAECLTERFPNTDIVQARSMRSGLRAIIEAGGGDVVVLDMAMPTYDISIDEHGGTPQAYGGRELLRHMSERDIVAPTIVITQFETFGQGSEALTLEQLDAQLRLEHEQYRGTVYYNSATEEWKDALFKMVSAAVSVR